MWLACEGKGGTFGDFYEKQNIASKLEINQARLNEEKCLFTLCFEVSSSCMPRQIYISVSVKRDKTWGRIFLCPDNVFSLTDRLFVERHTVHKAGSRRGLARQQR